MSAEGTGPYPVALEVERPGRFERRQVFLRLVIVLGLSLLLAFAWLVLLIYVSVPVFAATLISRDGPEEYIRSSHRRLLRYLHWIVALDAYITLLVDRLPLEEPAVAVRYHVAPCGRPTITSALFRLFYSIPSGAALALLGVAAVFTWIPAAAFILARGQYPEALYRFHLGVVGWGARLLAYHASMVDRYPPFSLDAGRA